MTQTSRTIFIFSLEPWGDMWYSKHHYAAFLAKSNTVYFVSTPDKWRWKDLFSMSAKVHEGSQGVKVVEYKNNLPLRFIPKWLADRVSRFNARKLGRLAPSGELVSWCFHPTSLLEGPALRRPGSKLIYHVVDPYQNLPNDSSFAKRSDLVVAINPWYLEYYLGLNPNCVLVPHGVREEDRGSDPEQVRAYQAKWGQYAVMAAGINYRTNYGLLIQVAKRYPDLHLVIVGQLFPLKAEQQGLRDSLFALPNVSYVGVKHPDKLRDIIRGARVGLVTYDFERTRDVPLGGEGTPLKVITYLAQSCPVISTINSYAPSLNGTGNFKAEDADHFVELVGRVLDGRIQIKLSAVNDYLDSVDYRRLTERIFSALGLDQAVVDSAPGLEQQVRGAVAEGGPSKWKDRTTLSKDSPVLIVSNEEWDGPRYSKHRYAVALGAYRDVYFIDPAQQWRPSHLFRWRIGSRTTPEGITVLSYQNAIPLLGGLLGSINDRVIAGRLRAFLAKAGRSRPLFWTFDPSRLASPAQLDAAISIYHCADDHAFRLKGERLLAQRCDHVFCIARDLMPRFRSLNASVHHVPHGLAGSDMQTAPLDRSVLPAKPGYALYIGNINDRHDFALWEKLFLNNPEVIWVVVGPVNVSDPTGLRLLQEKSYPNVIFLPPVPYADLQMLIAGSGSGFLFMRRDHPANRISSQKVVQFLAQGKPIFCSWFSEYADRQDLVYMTDTDDAALAVFARWRRVGEGPEAYERRIRFAESQLFTNLFGSLPFRL